MQLGLFDLLAPELLLGMKFPDAVSFLEEYITRLAVVKLHEAWDDQAIVYSGLVRYSPNGTGASTPQFTAASGSSLSPSSPDAQFRLTVFRKSSSQIKEVVDDTSVDAFAFLRPALNRLETQNVTTSDYPGFSFELELLLQNATLKLPASMRPARMGTDGWPEFDHTYRQPGGDSYQPVRLYLPKIGLVLKRGEEIGDFDIDFRSYGAQTFEDHYNYGAGEWVRMEPEIAMHKSGRAGFALDKVVMDWNDNQTPPEILEQFGIGDDFKGLWLPHVRFFFPFICNTKADIHAHDFLLGKSAIANEWQFSGELGLTLMARTGDLKVTPRFFGGATQIADKDDEATFKVAADNETGFQLDVKGGVPPYNATVTLRDADEESPGAAVTIPPTANGQLRWNLNVITVPKVMVATLTDSDGSNQRSWHKTFHLNPDKETLPQPVKPGIAPVVTDTSTDTNASYDFDIIDDQYPDKIVIVPNPKGMDSISVDGVDHSAKIGEDGLAVIDMPVGSTNVEVTAGWSGREAEPVFIYFKEDRPLDANDVKAVAKEIADGGYTFTMKENEREVAPLLSGDLLKALKRYLNDAKASGIAGLNLTLAGSSSYLNSNSKPHYNQELSVRRIDATRRVLALLVAETSDDDPIRDLIDTLDNHTTAHGLSESIKPHPADENSPYAGWPDRSMSNYIALRFQHALLGYSQDVTLGAGTRTKTLSRPAIRPPAPPEPAAVKFPKPNPPKRESWFEKAEVFVRFQRDELVKVGGTLTVDFERAIIETGKVVEAKTNEDQGDASAMGNDEGVVEFKVTVTHDPATDRWSVAVGAEGKDRDGLYQAKSILNPTFFNVLGALLTFAPLLVDNENPPAADEEGVTRFSLDHPEGFALAVGLGLAGVFETDKVTVYGVELAGGEGIGANVLLDYGVEFAVNLEIPGLLRISTGEVFEGAPGQDPTKQTVKVRYRGFGFQWYDPGDGWTFDGLFDRKRGYDMELVDSGVFQVDGALGKLLRVLGVQISRVNPLMLELDLGLSADLGVISVDKFRVQQRFDDPLQPPTILPAAIGINIPSTVTGSGALDLRDQIKGKLDVTVIPARLRIAASVLIQDVTEGDRTATGVLVGLQVEFPNPIPLFGSGLGLYGILGLFAMHFKRNENPNADLPALDWLNGPANGDPANTEGNAWVGELDRWSFGVGAVVGSQDGGKIFNAKGMFMLELPGPRFLLLMKANLLSEKPGTKGKVDEAGLLAAIDVNIPLGKITIGMLASYEIDPLISLQIPADILFSTRTPSDWHVYLGQLSKKASAEVLGKIKAKGYLMFSGKEISGFPVFGGGTRSLDPTAVALGISLSTVLGNEDSGLYLKAAGGIDVGLSFSPLQLHGLLWLEGKLRLFIVSISATAELAVDAIAGDVNQVFIQGKACGKVSFFIGSVSGCVSISLGDEPQIVPPGLIGAVAMQSRSPALVQSQGSDRAIDGVLGNAQIVSDVNDPNPPETPVVPIDTIPHIEFQAAPALADNFDTFTAPLQRAPRLQTDGSADGEGWVDQGGGVAVRYRLKRLELDPPLNLPPEEMPDAAWIAPSVAPSDGKDTNVNLALFTKVPDATPHAFQRSAELTETVTTRWEGVCDPVAPPTPVLWTFLLEQLGPDPDGWMLRGRAIPDPPETVRSIPADTKLRVKGAEHGRPIIDSLLALAGRGNREPAHVIGDDLRDPEFDQENPALPGRVLAAPFIHESFPTDFDMPSEYEQFVNPEVQKVIIDSGEIEYITMLLAVAPNLFGSGEIVVRALNDDGVTLDEQPLVALATVVTDVADMPPTWHDPTGPWATSAHQLFNYLGSRHPTFERLHLHWDTPGDTAKIEIFLINERFDLDGPILLIAGIEALRTAEERRATFDQETQTALEETLETMLSPGRPVPMLQPETDYTLSIEYAIDVRKTTDDEVDLQPPIEETMHYRFRTDNQAPARLHPWVLATAPHPDALMVFPDDPIELYFNNQDVVRLYETYGHDLAVRIRRADGNHPPEQHPVDLDALDDADGNVILTPFEDVIRDLVTSLPCVDEGVIESHSVRTIDVELARNSSYKLLVEADPVVVNEDGIVEPLLQVAFSTSGYANANELATAIRTARSEQRLLKAPVAALGSTPSDSELERALIDAGLERLPAPTEPRILYLWAPASGTEVLDAILIDAPEPLWRNRPEPVLIDEGGMEHYVEELRPQLEIVESEGNAQQLSRANGGMRTLVKLTPGATTLTLQLRKHELALSGRQPTSSDTLLLEEETIPTLAPWRQYDV